MFQLLLSMILFLAPTDPRLNEESEYVCPCSISSEEIQQTLKTLHEVAKSNLLVSLAAPQIGILKQIILIDTAATEEGYRPPPQFQEFINPEILWQSEKRILVRFYDREGTIHTEEYEGYLARIFQHEIDYLK